MREVSGLELYMYLFMFVLIHNPATLDQAYFTHSSCGMKFQFNGLFLDMGFAFILVLSLQSGFILRLFHNCFYFTFSFDISQQLLIALCSLGLVGSFNGFVLPTSFSHDCSRADGSRIALGPDLDTG